MAAGIVISEFGRLKIDKNLMLRNGFGLMKHGVYVNDAFFLFHSV